MKRLFYSAAFALTLFAFSSCAQHDPNSPDTSGAVPYNKEGAGIDTTTAGTNTNTGGAPNHNNDGTTNNQSINTHDSAQQK